MPEYFFSKKTTVFISGTHDILLSPATVSRISQGKRQNLRLFLAEPAKNRSHYEKLQLQQRKAVRTPFVHFEIVNTAFCQTAKKFWWFLQKIHGRNVPKSLLHRAKRALPRSAKHSSTP